MQLRIVRRVRGFVPEQIAVGPRREQRAVAPFRPFAHAQGDRHVRQKRANIAHDGAQARVGEMGIFAALQHHGAETQCVSLLRAGQNVRLAQPVALGAMVAPADAAIQAVVFAEIGKFDQPADVHVPPVDGLARRPRPGKEVGKHLPVPAGEQREHVRIRQAALRRQTVNKALQRCHR